MTSLIKGVCVLGRAKFFSAGKLFLFKKLFYPSLSGSDGAEPLLSVLEAGCANSVWLLLPFYF